MGGNISGKAGVTHFHVGEADTRLKPLSLLLDRGDTEAHRLYPTHVARNHDLLREAIALARHGCFVDIDTVDSQAARWVSYYREHNGPPDRLTCSSDAQTPGASPDKLHKALVALVREHGMDISDALPHFCTNAAAALQLRSKGRLREGFDADVLMMSRGDLRLQRVFARGRCVVQDGKVRWTRAKIARSWKRLPPPLERRGILSSRPWPPPNLRSWPTSIKKCFAACASLASRCSTFVHASKRPRMRL
jgi:beta-aspartyl-dipeptidase (metallo-type)